MNARRSMVTWAQRFVATVAFTLALPCARWRQISWLIGVHELASMIIQLGHALPDSFTVVEKRHPYYDAPYGLVIAQGEGRLHAIRNLLLGPWVFGSVAARARGVIYVGERGFLHAAEDEREWEMRFLKRRDRRAVVVFTGNDIRSPRLMSEMAERTGFDNIGAILARQGAPFDTPEYEAARKRRADVCDRFASAIFSAPVDQLSFIESEVLPFPYLYPDASFVPSVDKYESLDTIRIVHAPSNPTLKGTHAVRSAMRQIIEKYPHVSYEELTDVDNSAVRRALADAHIVLNQFHAYMPGVFGIEALAHHCVMLCSADPKIEPALEDADGAWVIATPDTLLDRLNDMLAYPERLRGQAERGYSWAKAHASQSARGARLRHELAAI